MFGVRGGTKSSKNNQVFRNIVVGITMTDIYNLLSLNYAETEFLGRGYNEETVDERLKAYLVHVTLEKKDCGTVLSNREFGTPEKFKKLCDKLRKESGVDVDRIYLFEFTDETGKHMNQEDEARMIKVLFEDFIESDGFLVQSWSPTFGNNSNLIVAITKKKKTTKQYEKTIQSNGSIESFFRDLVKEERSQFFLFLSRMENEGEPKNTYFQFLMAIFLSLEIKQICDITNSIETMIVLSSVISSLSDCKRYKKLLNSYFKNLVLLKDDFSRLRLTDDQSLAIFMHGIHANLEVTLLHQIGRIFFPISFKAPKLRLADTVSVKGIQAFEAFEAFLKRRLAENEI
eukprot:GHVH01002670.1.p1 GENE.GHVH01002670.1~~GHVH01002670.1.p1  ORF type:complete len:355 (+),score=23.41 GHVH01002670.1:34-1065(+)